MSNSFSWNDIDMAGDNYRVKIVSNIFPLMGKPRVNVMDLSGADGAVTQGATLGPLYFTFNCIIDAPDDATADTCMWNLLTALKATKEGEKHLVFDLWPTKRWDARLVSNVDFSLAITGGEFTLQFIAPDPDWTVIS